MDREEFREKQEEISRLVERKDYKSAMEIVDTIDWKRVKSVRTLGIVGEIYAANQKYEDSIRIFRMAYNRAKTGKNILSRLIEMSLKTEQFDEAEKYYEEFLRVAPNDNNRYILQYKIRKAQKAEAEELIGILEHYKAEYFTEKWSYELAKLYFSAGKETECVELCDTMIAWFGDGPYVLKAMDLKKRLGVLDGQEKLQYEEEFSGILLSTTDRSDLGIGEEEEEEIVIDPLSKAMVTQNTADYGANFPEMLKKSLRDMFSKKAEKAKPEEISGDAEYVEPLNIRHTDEVETANAPALETEHSLETEERTPQKDAWDLEHLGSLDDPVDPVEEIPEIPKAEESAAADRAKEEQKEKPQEFVFVQPTEEKLPPSMQESSLPDMDIIRQIMNERKLTDEEEKPEGEEKKVKEPTLNLEKMILQAAYEQGIEFGSTEREPEEAMPLESEAEIDRIQPAMSEKPELSEEEKRAEISVFETIRKNTEQKLMILEEDEEVVVLEENEGEDLFEEEIGAEHEDLFAEETGTVREDVFAEEEIGEEQEDLFTEDGSAGAKAPAAEESLDPEELIEREMQRILEQQALAFSRDVAQALQSRSVPEPENADADTTEVAVEEVVKAVEAEEEEETAGTEEDDGFGKTNIVLSEDVMQILPTVKRRTRELTQEEEELFSYFTHVPGIRSQIIDALCMALKTGADATSERGNIIVMGAQDTGKTTLISLLISAICKEKNQGAARRAFVFADNMNGYSMDSLMEKIYGGYLVIEDAGSLTMETVQDLNEMMSGPTDGLTVILEDEKTNMRKFMERYPEFVQKFTSVITIPVFTSDELVCFAVAYAGENGYVIDQSGNDAIYRWIGQVQKPDAPITVGVMKKMLDEVFLRVQNEAGSKKFWKRRAEVEGVPVLNEKDFKL